MHTSEEDTDPEVDEEEIAILERLKEKRLHQLAATTAAAALIECFYEKELLQLSANEPALVAHFCCNNFVRCRTMDSHLAKLAASHACVKFRKIQAVNAPFLCEKLGIKVLPLPAYSA